MEKNRPTSTGLNTYIGLYSVEVFQTNVSEEQEALQLSGILRMVFPHFDIHFDLEDCDNILRVEGHGVSSEQITSLMLTYGYQCKALV